LVPYGFVDDGTGDTAVAAFESWLVAQAEAGTPVQFVGEVDNTATVESYDPVTNYPNTVIVNDSADHMELEYNADTKTYINNRIGQSLTGVMEAIVNGSY
jgi:hypothetical protein